MTTIRTQSSRAVDAMVIETARLALELIEACNSDDVDRWAALYAPDYVGVDVGQPEPHYGPEGIARVMAAYRGAFPDLTFVETGTVVEPGRIAVFWTARGTHQGTIMHIPATGRAVEVRGASLLLVDQGKIRHGVYVWDVAGLLRALGLLPDL